MKKPMVCIIEQPFFLFSPGIGRKSLKHQHIKTAKTIPVAIVNGITAARHLLPSIWNEPLSLIIFIGQEPEVLDSVDFRLKRKQSWLSSLTYEPVWWWNEMRLRNGTVATALAFITSFLTLSWYTTWQNGKGKEDVSRNVYEMHWAFCFLNDA
jgi:hypothetical protein